MATKAIPAKAEGKGFEAKEERLHRIRITLSSKNVKSLEKGKLSNVHVLPFSLC